MEGSSLRRSFVDFPEGGEGDPRSITRRLVAATVMQLVKDLASDNLGIRDSAVHYFQRKNHVPLFRSLNLPCSEKGKVTDVMLRDIRERIKPMYEYELC